MDYAKIRKRSESLDLLPRAVFIEVMSPKSVDQGFPVRAPILVPNPPGIPDRLWRLLRRTLEFFHYLRHYHAPGQFTVSQAVGAFPNIGAFAGSGVALSWIANAQNLAVFLNALSNKTPSTCSRLPPCSPPITRTPASRLAASQPIPTGSYTGVGTSTSSVFSTIEYGKPASLNVTPHINAGGLVRLERTRLSARSQSRYSRRGIRRQYSPKEMSRLPSWPKVVPR